MRRTKHVKAGEEDARYSYVVIKRGPRPSVHAAAVSAASHREVSPRPEGATDGDGADAPAKLTSVQEAIASLRAASARTKQGILDQLRGSSPVERRMLEEVSGASADEGLEDAAARGRTEELARALAVEMARAEANPNPDAQRELDQKAESLMKSLAEAEDSADLGSSSGEAKLSTDARQTIATEIVSDVASEVQDSGRPGRLSPDEGAALAEALSFQSAPSATQASKEAGANSQSDEEVMRLEAYDWPRLVQPPLKKGGHVTFDACCASGE